MPATIILQYANAGWHVRWRAADSHTFEATRTAFKDTLSLQDRYWDPEAFEGKGGWWVAYGALGQVGHLFSNYQAVRDELEQEHWQRYEQQRKEARERFAHEQQQQQRTGRQQQTQQRRQAPPPPQQEIKLPKTFEEALALLSLKSPVSVSDVKRAYRAQAFRCHPDHGGSNAAMVMINAAYEIALASCT